MTINKYTQQLRVCEKANLLYSTRHRKLIKGTPNFAQAITDMLQEALNGTQVRVTYVETDNNYVCMYTDDDIVEFYGFDLSEDYYFFVSYSL